MQFIYPSFLWALSLLAIPVIIHLFYFRRFRKVYFTNVHLLKEVKEETSARRRIRNLIILMSRIGALASLVIAFAQPFFPANEKVIKGAAAVSVFIDNSFSMVALSEDQPLLVKAKQKAKEIIQAYSREDRFQILTHDFEGKHQQLVSQEDALGLIDEVETSAKVRNLSQVVLRQKQALMSGKNENHFAYIISDFQQSITDLDASIDTTISLSLVPLKSVRQKNLSVDSCWFTAPVQLLNQSNTLVVKVSNHSDIDLSNIRLSIRYQGQEKPVSTLQIPAGTQMLDTVNLSLQEPGWQQAEVIISDYPVVFDDSYFLSFLVVENMKVLSLFEKKQNPFLSAAFEGIPYFQFEALDSRNINYAKLPEFDLIILDDLSEVSSGLEAALMAYAKEGGNVLVFPSMEAKLNNYNSFLKGLGLRQILYADTTDRKVAGINTEEFIFFDVYEKTGEDLKLPATSSNFIFSINNNAGEEPLLTYRDGHVFLGKYATGKGNIYLCASPLAVEISDLVKNAPVFIPMLYKMSISSNKNNKIAYTIGLDEVLEIENNSSERELIYNLKGETDAFIPEIRKLQNKILLNVSGQVENAGFYELLSTDESSLGYFSFNFDRRESILSYFSIEQLAQLIGAGVSVIDGDQKMNLGNYVKGVQKSKQLWTYFLLLALLFLAVEVMLLRFWKD